MCGTAVVIVVQNLNSTVRFGFALQAAISPHWNPKLFYAIAAELALFGLPSCASFFPRNQTFFLVGILLRFKLNRFLFKWGGGTIKLWLQIKVAKVWMNVGALLIMVCVQYIDTNWLRNLYLYKIDKSNNKNNG